MKKLGLFVFLVLSLLSIHSIVAAEQIDYSVSNYYGHLTLNEDNTADFDEKISYHFDDDYNGQYVSLSLGGNLPHGVQLDKDKIIVSAQKNNSPATIRYELSEKDKNYEIKVYNPGKAGDDVILTVHWYLKNLLFLYKDSAILNWKPITDWDVPLKKVSFDVSVPKDGEGQIVAHTGYFSQSPKMTSQGSTYHAESVSVGKTFELHAFWDRKMFQETLPNIEGNGKSLFIKVENRIKQNTLKAHFIIEKLLPILFIVLISLSVSVYMILYVKVNKVKGSLDLNRRLYENPENLTPLELAQNVYNSSLMESSPIISQKTQLSFNNIIIASLLDLVDRGNLSLEEDSNGIFLRRVQDDSLSNSESKLLELALGNSNECYCDKLFSDYNFNTSAKKKKSKEVQRKSRSYLTHLKSVLREIDRDVRSSVSQLGLTDVWREPNLLELNTLYISYGLLLLTLILSLGSLLYVYNIFNYHLYSYWVFVIVSVIIGILIYRFNCLKKGILVGDNALRYQYWHSFENMIHQIDTFNRAEIQSIAIWNRLLVYATLFGEAKKVIRVMHLNNIVLTNEDIQIYVTNPLVYTHLAHSMSHYASSVSIAQEIKNSSQYNGGSGSFSSGGFSGGGGGGGGGAF